MNSLYCFLAAEGLVFLKRGYLPFCSPEQLAEPWMQANSYYSKPNTPAIAADDFHQHLQQQYEKLPDHLRSMVSFDYFVKQSQEKRGQIEASLVAAQQDLTAKAFNPSVLREWRVLTLFSQWQDSSLWQQFGASGQGLVIEFDAKSSFFSSESYNDQAQHFSSVSQVAHWQPMDDLYYFFHRPIPEGKEQEQEIEWRLLRNLSSADRKIEVQGAQRAMYRLPFKAVKQIILGYGCSPEYCQQVKLYLSQDIHYRHVQCVQARINPKTMLLEQVPC